MNTNEIMSHAPVNSDEINMLVKSFMEEWKINNPEYPENDYRTGVNDGAYLVLRYLTMKGYVPQNNAGPL